MWSTTSAPPLVQAGTDSYWSFDGSTQWLPLALFFSPGELISAIDVEVTFRTSEPTVSCGSSGCNGANWAFLDFDRSEFFDFYVTSDGRIGFSCKDSDSDGSFFDAREINSVSLADGQWLW